MSEKPEAEAGKETAPPKKSKKKLILIVVALLVIVGGVGVPMVLMKGGDAKTGEAEEAVEEPPKLKLAELGVFIVNLMETSAFLKVNIKIEYDAGLLERLSAEGGEGGGEGHGGGYSGGGEGGDGGLPSRLKEREAVIRDAIIRVLSAKKTEDVLSVEGKEQLKEEILEGLNDATGFDQPIITNVYFSEFIVQ